MFYYYSKSLLFVNRFSQKISNNMFQKPKIQVDAVILIDIWSPDSFLSIVSGESASLGDYTSDQWLNYMTAYQKGCHNFLQRFHFDVLINATYRTAQAPTYNSAKNLADEDQDEEFSPFHYKKYDCDPHKKLYTDCQIADVRQFVKPNGKIVVGGGSWGACVHFRPVGMTRLMNAGFRVFTAPELCYGIPTHRPSGEKNTGIHHQDMLIDDIVWSRSNLNGYYYDFLYEGLMIHPDNALDRRDAYGVAHRDKPG